MDREAWQATVHGLQRVRQTEATVHACTRRGFARFSAQ